MKNLIFDFDGTLADSRKLVVHAMRAGFAKAGLPQPADELTLSIMGIPLEIGVKQILPQHLSAADQRDAYDDIVRGFRHYYLSHHEDLELYPNVKATLTALKQSGHRLFVASSKSRDALKEELATLGIINDFEYILSSNDVKYAKPAPDAVVSLVRTFDLAKNDTVMIGDASFDLAMGKHAGVFTCAVTWGAQSQAQLKSCKPDVVLDEFSQLAKIDDYITTGAVTLRQIEISDAKRLYQLVKTNQQHLGQWFDWVSGIDSQNDEELALRKQLMQARTGQSIDFAIELDKTLVGVISLQAIDLQNNSAAVKFWLAAAYCKRGVMAKAVPLLESYAFSTLDLHRLRLQINERNTAAIEVANSNQFMLDGRLVDWHKTLAGYDDVLIFSKKTYQHDK